MSTALPPSDPGQPRSQSQRARLRIRTGYGAQVWLTPEQWDTYRRRPPVRYLVSKRKEIQERDGLLCHICSLPGDAQHPLQIAHAIPFSVGVIDLGLTPDWIDDLHNLRLAHKGPCNNQVELTPLESVQRLIALGHNLSDSPAFSQGFITVQYDSDGHANSLHFHP